MARKPKIPTEQLSAETRELFDVLNNEADLAVILIGTSFLDACLKSLLENKLLKSSVSEKLLDYRGTFGTLSARADLCYVLGLISKAWYNDLCTFAKIRNLVAHHHQQQTFLSPDISDKCANLSLSPLTFPEGVVSSPRDRFTICVALLANSLLLTALRIKHERAIESPRKSGHTYLKIDGTPN